MFLNMSRVIVRGIHPYVLQVACSTRDWKDSYLEVVHRERSGQIIRIILVSERQVDHGASCVVGGDLVVVAGSLICKGGEISWKLAS